MKKDIKDQIKKNMNNGAGVPIELAIIGKGIMTIAAANQFENNDRHDSLYPDVVVTFTDGFTNIPSIDPVGALTAAAQSLQNVTA